MSLDALSTLQSAVLVLLLCWPSARCPDLVCPAADVVERVPVSVDRSLDFAVTTAERCRADQEGSRSGCLSLFWLGVLVGILFSFIVVAAFHGLRAPLTARPGQDTASRPSSSVVEPSTPAHLRKLGLLR